VVLGDGAEWIWNQASLHFPDAIQIVDLYHAREPLWSLGAKLYPHDSPAQKRWVMVRKDELDEGKIERLVALLGSQAASHPERAEDVRTEANYFEDNKERMRYPQFRKQGLFLGSGVIAQSQCHHCPPLLSAQRQIRGLLGGPTGVTLTLKSHTPARRGRRVRVAGCGLSAAETAGLQESTPSPAP
jgi:hypothetical protein